MAQMKNKIQYNVSKQIRNCNAISKIIKMAKIFYMLILSMTQRCNVSIEKQLTIVLC